MPDPAVADAPRLIVARSPFRLTDRVEVQVHEGSSVLVMLATAGIVPDAHVAVDVDGERVAPIDWPTVRPRAGAFVCVRALPEGGGDEGGGKTALRIVAMIAVIALAIITGGAAAPLVGATGTTGLAVSAVVTATVSVAGQLAINALIPPPKLRPPTSPSGNVQNAITGSRNVANLWGVMPRVFAGPPGWRIFPCHASLPFQEIRGNKVYFKQLFDLGMGPVDIGDPRIGATPLFANASVQYEGKMTTDPVAGADPAFTIDGEFKGVEMEFRQGYDDDDPITLVDQEVHEEPLSLTLRGPEQLSPSHIDPATGHLRPAVVADYKPQTRRSLVDATALSVDVHWPLGVNYVRTDGSSSDRRVKVQVEYQAVGATEWTKAPGSPIDITDHTDRPRLRSLKWDVARGQYDVRLTRQTPRSDAKGVQDLTRWAMLRTHRVANFGALKGHGLVAISIRASNQLTGIIDAFNVKVTSRIRKWNGSAWVETPTGNPAAVYREILQAKDNHMAIADADAADQIDLARLQAWSVRCDDLKYSCAGVFDSQSTVPACLKVVAAVGRASFTVRDGKISVIEDVAQTTPAGWFGPRNSRNYAVNRVFPEVPHALRARWQNPALDYKWDEQLVYADGYGDGSGGTTLATVFETMEFPFIDNGAQVWGLARYNLAVLRDRANVHTIVVDPEGTLSCERGDMVRVQQEFLAIGIATGRVLEVTLNGSNDCTSITLDVECEAPAGPTYGVRIRHDDLTEVVKQLASVTIVVREDGAKSSVLAFTSAIAAASVKVKVDDLCFFGVHGEETKQYLIKAMMPTHDMDVQMQLLDDAPTVRTADQADRPAWAEFKLAGEIGPDTREPTDQAPPAPLLSLPSGGSGSQPSDPAIPTKRPAQSPPGTKPGKPSTPTIRVDIKKPNGKKHPKAPA